MSEPSHARPGKPGKRVKQTGVRLKYIDALDPRWASFPRDCLVNHAADWYTDGHLASGRPLFGLLSMSNYAEYLLHHARVGRHGQSRGLAEAAEFFAATRRAMFEVLRKIPSWRDPNPKELARLRRRVGTLCALARKARDATGGKSKNGIDTVPQAVL